jgi:DNA-binding response OmpR family regulator
LKAWAKIYLKFTASILGWLKTGSTHSENFRLGVRISLAIAKLMTAVSEANIYDDGYLRVEFDCFYVACRGKPIYTISRKEFLIFACLLRANGRPVSHQDIWRQVWQDEELKDTVLRVHVTSIRRKLSPYGIEVIPMIGVGYYLQIMPPVVAP